MCKTNIRRWREDSTHWMENLRIKGRHFYEFQFSFYTIYPRLGVKETGKTEMPKQRQYNLLSISKEPRKGKPRHMKDFQIITTFLQLNDTEKNGFPPSPMPGKASGDPRLLLLPDYTMAPSTPTTHPVGWHQRQLCREPGLLSPLYDNDSPNHHGSRDHVWSLNFHLHLTVMRLSLH